MHPSVRLFATKQGRLRRRTFLWSTLLLMFVFVALYSLLESSFGRASTLVIYVPFFWCAFSLAIKRLHDREKSGWWLLLIVIPVLGPLVLFFWLLLGRGTRGENRFGPDPRSLNADYLTVSIGA